MLKLTLANTNFRPGDEITGTVRWQFDEPPGRTVISLCWCTRGKGTKDEDIVASDAVEHPSSHGEHAFRFVAPGEPHSFSGRLISLIWAVEASAEPREDVDRIEIVIAPEGREIELPTIEASPMPQAAQSIFSRFLSSPPRQ